MLRAGAALRLTAAGMIGGGVIAAWTARPLQSFLFGVTGTDPLTYALVAAATLSVALLACWRAARTAASVDPMTLLRL